MATINPELNFVHILHEGLEDHVKRAVTEKLIKSEMDNYEKKIRPKIQELVNSVTFDSIDNYRDYAQLRDELHVFLRWAGEEPIERETP